MRLRRDVLHSYQARDSQAAQQKWTQRRQNAFNWTLMERKQPQAHWAKASVQVNQKLAGHPGEGSLSRSLNCRRANWISGGTQSHAAIPKAASETDHQAQELQSQVASADFGQPFSSPVGMFWETTHPDPFLGPIGASKCCTANHTVTGLTRLNTRSPLGPMTWSDSGSAVPSAKNSSVAVMEKNTLSAQCSTRQNGCRKHPGGAQM
ncbi:uncharacterized protein [Thunnus thynnus]|uniref:uncharacterized protein isoform X1 n=2 Tax=Thunnus thynnus TaxID=8237 RepID=UPI003528F15F